MGNKVSRREILGAGAALATIAASGAKASAATKAGRVAIDDVSLHYWDSLLEGEPVIFLHPHTGDGSSWVHQRATFENSGYRVISYSRRGHRNSSSGSAERPGTGAQDLSALARRLRLHRFHLVGAAAGAFVAADFAIAYPGNVASLTLAASIVGHIDDKPLNVRLRPEGFEKMPASFRELSPSYRAEHPEGVKAWEAVERTSKQTGAIRQPLINKLSDEALGGIKTPTLLIAGGADLYAPPPLMRSLHKTIPGSELAVFPECGHAPHWEQPELFNSTVIDFLRKHRA